MNKSTENNDVRFFHMENGKEVKKETPAQAAKRREIEMYNAEIEAAKQWKKSANKALRYVREATKLSGQ